MSQQRPPEGPERSHEHVEVWCPSLDRWVHGFSAVARTGAGITVRRHSDDTVLPVAFQSDRVRPAPTHLRIP